MAIKALYGLLHVSIINNNNNNNKESCDLNWAMRKPRNSTTLVMIVDKINWLLNR
jgi:hypothetical protein